MRTSDDDALTHGKLRATISLAVAAPASAAADPEGFGARETRHITRQTHAATITGLARRTKAGLPEEDCARTIATGNHDDHSSKANRRGTPLTLQIPSIRGRVNCGAQGTLMGRKADLQPRPVAVTVLTAGRSQALAFDRFAAASRLA